MSEIEKIQKLTGENDQELLTILYENTVEKVLAMTNRTEIPAGLVPVVRELTIISWNRMGTQGETSRSEGGISASFVDIPTDIEKIIHNFRLAKVNGYAHAKKQTETISP